MASTGGSTTRSNTRAPTTGSRTSAAERKTTIRSTGGRRRRSGGGGGGTNYKIIGNGSNSTIIRDRNNTPRILFSPEAPEILFEDYGTGKLINGSANIIIDPIFKDAIYVDDHHPLKVFIQLEGDCNGVYVTNKSANGFTVKAPETYADPSQNPPPGAGL